MKQVLALQWGSEKVKERKRKNHSQNEGNQATTEWKVRQLILKLDDFAQTQTYLIGQQTINQVSYISYFKLAICNSVILILNERYIHSSSHGISAFKI